MSNAVQELQSDLHQLDEERRFAVDEAERFRQNLRVRGEEASADNRKLATLVREKDDLEAEVTRVRRENARLLENQQHQQGDVTLREDMLRQELEEEVKKRAEEEVSREALDARVKSLEEELLVSKKKAGDLTLQRSNAEFELIQLRKTIEKDHQAKANLEIALMAKQQELDLVSVPFPCSWLRSDQR